MSFYQINLIRCNTFSGNRLLIPKGRVLSRRLAKLESKVSKVDLDHLEGLSELRVEAQNLLNTYQSIFRPWNLALGSPLSIEMVRLGRILSKIDLHLG